MKFRIALLLTPAIIVFVLLVTWFVSDVLTKEYDQTQLSESVEALDVTPERPLASEEQSAVNPPSERESSPVATESESARQVNRVSEATPVTGPESSEPRIKLEPIEVIEARVFMWEVSTQIPESSIASIEWEQISGVPIKILQGRHTTLVAEAPFIAEQQVVEIQVAVTETNGRVSRTTSTVTITLYEPASVKLTGRVELPANILPYPSNSLKFFTVLGENFDDVTASDFPVMVMAVDDDGWVLLSAAKHRGGLFGEAEGEVLFSVDTTAIILMAIRQWESIPSLTPERVSQMKSSPSFSNLTSAVQSLLKADKNFTERVGRYEPLLEAVDHALAEIPR